MNAFQHFNTPTFPHTQPPTPPLQCYLFKSAETLSCCIATGAVTLCIISLSSISHFPSHLAR